MRDPNEDVIEDNYDRIVSRLTSDSLSTTISVWIDDVKWRAKLTNQRIIEERSAIYGWVLREGTYYDLSGVNWDGQTCIVEYGGFSEVLGDRQDLMCIIPELEEIPLDGLDLITRL